jgi:hypothetical protein
MATPKKRQRKKRATDAELEEIIDFTRDCIAKRLRPSTIKMAIRTRFGECDHRTIGTYIARAREQLLIEVAKGKHILRSEQKEFYESIIGDPDEKTRERLRAAERLDALMGLQDNTLQNPVVGFLESLPPNLRRAVSQAIDAELSSRGTAGGDRADPAGTPGEGSDPPGPSQLGV